MTGNLVEIDFARRYSLNMVLHRSGSRRLLRFFTVVASLSVLLAVLFGCTTTAGGFAFGFNYDDFAKTQKEDQVSNASIFLDTVWEIDQVHPVTGGRTFTLRFHKNGVLQNFHPNDRTPSDDRWSADSASLTIYFNGSYSVYRGTIESEGVVIGTATNRGGDVWRWRAVRVSHE